MKVTGNNNEFDSNKELLKKEAFALNRKDICIFNNYDKDNNGEITPDELLKLFKDLALADKNMDKILDDAEIKTLIKENFGDLKLTVEDVKLFLSTYKSKNEKLHSKSIAQDIFLQIDGLSLPSNTKKQLARINQNNVVDVVKNYEKFSQGESLADAINNEFLLNIETVKKYICEPLVLRAKALNIDNVKLEYNNLSNIAEIDTFIKELVNRIDSEENSQNTKHKSVVDIDVSFNQKSKDLLYIKPHNTKFLDVAQDSLGLVEVTEEEYQNLSPEERKKTQMALIGKYGNINQAWCAHAVSSLCEQAGIDIGKHKMAVSEFINWAKNNEIYRPIKTGKSTKNNYIKERNRRAKQIIDQLPNMSEGDLIVWKSDYSVKLPDKTIDTKIASHIGIIEDVDFNKGIVTVIEGNANISKTSEEYDRDPVKTESDGIMGNQEINEYKEVNRRDGLIRKQYTFEELALNGYSGYIDMQNLV